MKELLPVLFAIMLMAAPASAAYTRTGPLLGTDNYERIAQTSGISYNVTPGDAIGLIIFKVYRGSYVNFTIHYGAGNSVDGSIQNYPSDGLPIVEYAWTTSTITLNGNSKTYTYGDVIPAYDFDFAGYARDEDTNQSGFIAYQEGYGSFDNDLAVFMPVSSISTNLISGVTATGSQPFDIEIQYGSYSDIAESASESVVDVLAKWLTLLFEAATTIYNLVVSAIYWFKFLFVDNIWLVIALYLTGTMAFAARNARGRPDKFLRAWFRDQLALFRFIMEIPTWIANVINLIRRTIF